MRYIHHLVDSQKFRFVPDLGEIGHFEVAREGEDMNKMKTTGKVDFEKPNGAGAEKLASKLENNNEKEFSKREVKK
ncbi:MAG: hypothetical protein QXU98_04015 [Candidatus Parvarchaeota archaeon]